MTSPNSEPMDISGEVIEGILQGTFSVYILFHKIGKMYGESIYNLVPREYVPPEKPPMHQSKFNPDPTFPGSTFGCRGSTRLIGAGKMSKKPFSNFGPKFGETYETSPTLTQSAKMSLSNPSLGTYAYTDKQKERVPARDERPVLGIKSHKNFITANAVEAILQVPKSVESEELNYLKKEDYGKVPKYLTYVKEEIKRENDMIQKYVKEQMGEIDEEPEHIEEMDHYERRELIDALKLKWDKTNAKYQKITHLVSLDTEGQKRRKEDLEHQLKTLESDIEKLQKLGPLFIRGD